MSLVKFAVDFDNHRLLVSERQNSDRGAAQPAVWKNYTQLEVYPVRPKASGGLLDPLEAIDVTDRTLHVYIGTLTGTLYASLIDFVGDEDNNRFTGVLSMNSAALTTAFAGTTTEVNAYIEFRLIGDGEPRSVIKPIKILRPVWTGASEPDVEDQTPEWLVENLALILDDSDTVDVQNVGNSFTFHVRRKTGGRIGADADGIYVEEIQPAPDGFLASLRLESPFDGGSLTDALNLTDSEAIVAGGEAGVVYETRLHIRGRTELRDYADGSAIGKFYTGASDPAGVRNAWLLTISDPPQSHHLNYSAGAEDLGTLDYLTPPLLIAGGATVTLSYDTQDSEQLPQSASVAGVDLPAGTGVPFIQIDMPPDAITEYVTTYEEADITDAGSTPIEMGHPHRVKSVDLNVDVEPYPEDYTHNVYLPVTPDLHEGDLMLFSLFMAAAEEPTINIRNGSAAGTILFGWAGDVVARHLEIKCRFNGTAWEYRGHYEVNEAEDEGETPLLDQVVAASAEIDLDAAPYQTLSRSANFTLSTLGASRAPSGKVKEVAVLITNTSGGAITVSYATGIKKPITAATGIGAGEKVWFSLTSMGPTEAETHVGTVLVS